MAKIKLSNIKNEAKKLDEVKKYYLNETDWIEYHTVFSYKKMQDLMKDLLVFMDYSNKLEEGKRYPNNNIELDIFINFLIIKHFTSLRNELKGKSYEVHIATMTEMIDVGWYRQFIGLFDKLEISKVMEIVDATTLTLNELNKRNDLENNTETTVVN